MTGQYSADLICNFLTEAVRQRRVSHPGMARAKVLQRGWGVGPFFKPLDPPPTPGGGGGGRTRVAVLCQSRTVSVHQQPQ